MAEGAGLEPAIPVRETVFETVAIAARRPFLSSELGFRFRLQRSCKLQL